MGRLVSEMVVVSDEEANDEEEDGSGRRAGLYTAAEGRVPVTPQTRRASRAAQQRNKVCRQRISASRDLSHAAERVST